MRRDEIHPLPARVGALVGALICAAWFAAVSPAAAQRPTIELPANADTVVLEYTTVHHMLAEQDPEPLLRIFADGRVRVHYPVYMAKAGDYEARISAAELRGLLLYLAADGVLEFDPSATREQRAIAAAAERSAGRLHHVSDVTETLIEIRLGSYRAADAQDVVTGFRKSVRWPNVYTDAQRFGAIAGVQTLARAEERLRAFLNRPDLARVR